jgi:hypothetical protein
VKSGLTKALKLKWGIFALLAFTRATNSLVVGLVLLDHRGLRPLLVEHEVLRGGRLRAAGGGGEDGDGRAQGHDGSDRKALHQFLLRNRPGDVA